MEAQLERFRTLVQEIHEVNRNALIEARGFEVDYLNGRLDAIRIVEWEYDTYGCPYIQRGLNRSEDQLKWEAQRVNEPEGWCPNRYMRAHGRYCMYLELMT